MKVATVLVLLAVCAVSEAKPRPSGPPPSGSPPSGPSPSGPSPSGPPPSGSPTFNDKKQAALKTLLRSLSSLGKANKEQQFMDGVKGFLGEGVTDDGMDKRDFTDGQAPPRTSPKPRTSPQPRPQHQKRHDGPHPSSSPKPPHKRNQRGPTPPAPMDPFMDGVMGMLMEGVTDDGMDKRDFTDDGQASPRTSPKPRTSPQPRAKKMGPTPGYDSEMGSGMMGSTPGYGSEMGSGSWSMDKKSHDMGMPTMMYPNVYPSYNPMMFPGMYPTYDPNMGYMYPSMGYGMGSTPYPTQFPNYSGMDMNAAIDTLYQACMQRQQNMMTSYEWGLFDQVKDEICRSITDNDTWAADTVAAALLD